MSLCMCFWQFKLSSNLQREQGRMRRETRKLLHRLYPFTLTDSWGFFVLRIEPWHGGVPTLHDFSLSRRDPFSLLNHTFSWEFSRRSRPIKRERRTLSDPVEGNGPKKSYSATCVYLSVTPGGHRGGWGYLRLSGRVNRVSSTSSKVPVFSFSQEVSVERDPRPSVEGRDVSVVVLNPSAGSVDRRRIDPGGRFTQGRVSSE